MITKVEIGDICNISSAGDKPAVFSNIETESCRIPVIANGIDNEGIIGYTDGAKVVSEAVTVSARGNVGTAFYRSAPYYPVIRLLTVIPKNYSSLDCKYLYYLLRNSPLKGIGSVQAQLTVPDVSKMEVFYDSDIIKQKYISDILWSIDTKIEKNNAICADLEAMAKLLYDYWFVQFDFPDENGKPYKSSGGKMVWNEDLKREIPEGWEVHRLGDLITYNRGVSYTGKDLDDVGTPIISLASIDRSGRYIPDGIKYYNQPYPSSKVIRPFDLVMANTDMTQERAVMGRIIFVPDIFDGDILSTHHITQIHVKDELKSYLMMTTQTDWFHNYIKGFSSGTNVLGMDMIGFEDYLLACPKTHVLQHFNSIIYQLYKKIFNGYKENSELVSLRDFLLPMLMNGQVKVSAAE